MALSAESALFDHSPLAMAWVAPDGHIVSANASLAALTGYSADELRGMPYGRLLQTDERTQPLCFRNGGEGNCPGARPRENVYRGKDGRIIHGLTSVASTVDDPAPALVIVQDVSEREAAREQMEASLHESEARFNAFAAVGSDLLWETDEAYRVTAIVGDARAVLGLSEKDVIGRTFWDLAAADETDPPWQRHIDDHRAFRPFRHFEYQIADRSGAPRWISANGRPHYDAEGRFVGYRGAATNIGARKLVEAKLGASARQQQSAARLSQLALRRVPVEELYELAVELVAQTINAQIVGIFELSVDRRILRMRAGRGWPVRSAARAVPIDFCPPLARGVTSDTPVTFSPRNFNLLADAHDVNGAGVAVPIGEASVRTGVLVACSKSAQAFGESELAFLNAVSFVLAADAEQRRTNAELRLRDRALECAAEGIMITDATELDTPIVYVNPAFERITGYGSGEAIGYNPRFLQGDGTEQRAVRAIRTAVDGRETYKGQVLNYRKDGSSFWNGLTISPITAPDGTISHFVGVLSDQTERIQLESQLKQAQKMESLGHLTGGVAHDFNNLLAVILGNTEILCEEAEDPTLKEIAELVMSTAEKGADLTQRLLAFGRRQPLHPEPVDLGDLVGALSEMLRRTIGDHITLTTRADTDRFAYADRSLFESALLNLALNARDAMPSGGVLTIATDTFEAGENLAAHLKPGTYLCVSVTDTGTGMTTEVLERAFDPFFTTKNLGKGSGMGLSMVYGFAKQSGGHVAIESMTGSGTTVRLFLPVATGETVVREDKAPKAEEAPARGGSERILLVEDEPQLRRLVSGQLTGLGYNVVEAEAGAPALDILRQNPEVDLLFTDIIMPGGMSGLELVENVRGFLPGLKVLLTTGYAADDDNVIADIKDPILKKPYKKQQLAHALRDVLDRAA